MAEQAELKDSNMANYGGEDHMNAVKDAAATDPAWKDAGAAPGIEIWRVENKRTEADTPDFGIARWPKQQFGEFYDGDSYIVMHTYKEKDPVTGKVGNDLAHDIHFWLGKDTSTDEKGVAAYKTVELDTLLDDKPVQHREVMGNESPLFQSYFKKGIQYLSGGVASGFRKVKPEEYKPRLLEVRRTKKTTRASQVACEVGSMNKGDCYILDLGTTVYKWLGPEASPFEKSACANILANIITSRDGKAKEEDLNDDFWTTLGGEEGDVADAIAHKPSAAADAKLDLQNVKMFRISDDSGSISFAPIDKADAKGYTTAQLDSGDVFVVDAGISIFVWRGKNSSKKEKSYSWKLVDDYMENNDISNSVPVTVIDEGKINIVFRSSFAF